MEKGGTRGCCVVGGKRGIYGCDISFVFCRDLSQAIHIRDDLLFDRY